MDTWFQGWGCHAGIAHWHHASGPHNPATPHQHLRVKETSALLHRTLGRPAAGRLGTDSTKKNIRLCHCSQLAVQGCSN
jgi:hypothetical protein